MRSLSSTPTPSAAPVHQSQPYQNMSQSETLHINMATIPETPLDMSMLNLGTHGGWGMNNISSFNFQQPQVFAVVEVPEGPANPIDTEALSGKGFSSFYAAEDESPIEEVKHDYPVIDRPVESEKTVDAIVEDDNDPEYDLYRSSPTPSTASTTTPKDQELSSGNVRSEKESAHFGLIVSSESDDQALMERFEKMCATMEPVLQRIQAMTSHLDL
jgi:hypothetical protein